MTTTSAWIRPRWVRRARSPSCRSPAPAICWCRLGRSSRPAASPTARRRPVPSGIAGGATRQAAPRACPAAASGCRL